MSIIASQFFVFYCVDHIRQEGLIPKHIFVSKNASPPNYDNNISCNFKYFTLDLAFDTSKDINEYKQWIIDNYRDKFIL